MGHHIGIVSWASFWPGVFRATTHSSTGLELIWERIKVPDLTCNDLWTSGARFPDHI